MVTVCSVYSAPSLETVFKLKPENLKVNNVMSYNYFKSQLKDLPLQTESSLMCFLFLYGYLYSFSLRYFCLAGAAELIDVSRLF